jgi:hypothetical protein
MLPQPPRHWKVCLFIYFNVKYTLFWFSSGLRVGQVKALFQLPSYFPIKADILLWFTPLCKPDSVTEYYHISRSTRTKRGITGLYAEIIPITRLVRNVTLIPLQDNDKDFLLNSHVDGHSFSLFKLGFNDCLPN